MDAQFLCGARLDMELMRHVPTRIPRGVGLGVACVLALTCFSCGENTSQLIYAEHDYASDAGKTMSAIGTPVGYATVPTGDLQSTIGGGVQPADFVATCSELKAMLEDTNSRVIVVTNPIDCHLSTPVVTTACERACESATNDSSRKTYRVLPSTAADCSAIGGATTDPIVQKKRNDAIINVSSNKTLLGQTAGTSIVGATLYIKGQSNIIVQNLVLGDINPSLLEAGDAITIDASDHVWVDHCTFSKISDGFVDAINGSGFITISWNRFEGANPDACAGQHNYTNTIEGVSVTLYGNFYDHTLGCSPKVSQGSRVHLFNNYWLNALYYSIQVASESQVLIQGNDFEESRQPFYASDGCFADAIPCGITAPADTPNSFEGISASEAHEVGGAVVSLPYDTSSYQVQPASAAKSAVIATAGATLVP